MMNKKVVIIFGMILLVAGVTYAAGVKFFAGDSHGDINEGLVLNLDLTQDNYVAGTKTFADDSRNGNNGVSTNAATFTTDKYGKSTGAVSFDEANDYVSVPYSFGQPNTISISAWFKTSSNGIIFDQHDAIYPPTQPQGDIPVLWVLQNGSLRMELWMGNIGAIYSSTNFSDNNWHQAVAVGNTNIQYLYVDGVLIGSRSGTLIQTWWNLSTIGIGWSGGREGYISGWTYFDGSISEVKIWNRALSATEVLTLYNSSKPKMTIGSIESGLVGHWALNSEGYNSVTNRVTDKTPYENHGTNSGATLTTDRMGQSNGAMSFDGGSDFISVGASSSITFSQSSPWSISGWVKSTNSSLGGAIFSNQKGYATNQFGITAGISGNKFYNYIIKQNIVDQNLVGTTIISNDTWHHFVSVSNGTTLFIYVDGISDATPQAISFSGATTGNGAASIGRYGDLALIHFNGSIADVRIYNRALSLAEINTLYNSYNTKASLDSLQKGLVFDMPLTSSATKSSTPGSEIMTDKTPYSNDGQNSGASIGSSYTSFDGSNDYVNISSIVNNIRTISFWMKTNNDTNYPMTFIDTNSYLLSKWGYFSGDNSTRYVNGVVATETLGSEKIANTAFDSALTGWAAANGASAVRDTSTYVSSPACAKITYPGPTQNDFYTPTYFSVVNGTLYEISFWAKGEDARQWGLAGNEWSTWLNIGLGYLYNVTTSWKKYTYYAYAKKTTSDAYFSFTGASGATQFILYVDDITVKPVTSDSATVNNGEWNHFAIVSNSSLYANQFIIGESKFGFTTENYFNGSLSSLKIYNRALSDSEIKLLYDRGR